MKNVNDIYTKKNLKLYKIYYKDKDHFNSQYTTYSILDKHHLKNVINKIWHTK
jgi:hypothetical protein